MARESEKAKDPILLIQEHFMEGHSILGKRPISVSDADKWKQYSLVLLRRVFGENSEKVDEFTKAVTVRFRASAMQIDPNGERDRIAFESLRKGTDYFEVLTKEIDRFGLARMDSVSTDPFDCIVRICNRFHLVAKQLRVRHDSRNTLEIKDEYDVQDLLHALLHLDFDDIRGEEWTPSYAGKSSRMDFLLKKEKIVVEVKMSRVGLGAKELGDQLLIDCGRYGSHPDCKILICFVYDPDGRIGNPRGIENDLSKDDGQMKIRVFIRPL